MADVINFFYSDDGESVGPVSREELLALVESKRINENTYVIEENGAQWRLLKELFPGRFEGDMTPVDMPEELGLFTLNKTGPIKILPMSVKKRTARAVVLQEYEKMPDGSQRKILVYGKDIIPSTPEQALRQFIPAEERRIDELRTLLHKEEAKLQQARDLLEQKVSERLKSEQAAGKKDASGDKQ